MQNEQVLIRENLKNFKQLLKEYASREDIVNAINNREVIKIYYAGDDTMQKGYRTVEPYALGFIKKKDEQGDLAIRAWEQAGASDSYNDMGRWAKHPPRLNHEYFNDPNKQPGWRLFKLNNITSLFFTGIKFPKKGKNLRPLYNPNDKQLQVVLSLDPSSSVGSQEVTGIGSVEVPDELQQKLSAFDTQAKSWQIDASDQEATLIKNVVGLWEMIRKYRKKSPKDYVVAKKEGKYYAVPYWNRRKFDENEIVGNLYDLYNKYTKPEWKEMNFHEKMKKIAMDASNKAKEKQEV